ncbi:Isopenicillin N synthase-like, Fe(2+) 2OG dioxygenase domain, partial [Dillenia turbinata]
GQMSMEDVVRVQTLAQSGLSHVPPHFIQPPQSRPTPISTSSSDDDDQIPLIDLFHFDPGHSSDVLLRLRQVCRDWGAFHVTNHGIPIGLLDEMRTVGRSFFEECPMSEKRQYACDPTTPATEGYGSRMLVDSNDSVLDWRDYFDHHTLPIYRRNPSNWPLFPSNYRQVVAEYSDQMKVLAEKLLGLIAESLGLKSSCIQDAVGEFYQNITVSYYPPCPQPELTLGLQAHSDMGAITLLIQDDVGGLQVLKDGKWVTAFPLPDSDAIVVLLADQTEIITNGEYKSAEHRAITNTDRARLSIATFHDPAKTMNISPAHELISESSPPRYRTVLYGEFVSSWYAKGPEGKRNLDALLL